MKIKRLVAAIVTVSMVMSFAGCSKGKKITTEKFIDIVSSYGASEVKFSKLDRVDDGDFEDGFYTQFEGSDLEDTDGYEDAADEFDFPFEADDIVSGAIYMQASGISDLEDMDSADFFEDAEIDVIIASQITLSEDMSEDIIEYYGDLLDMIDIDLDDLSDEEYTDNSLVLNLDLADVASEVADMSLIQMAMAFADSETQDMINEVLDNASGNICFGIYVNGDSLVLVIGISYGMEPALVDTLCSDLGLTSPVDVEPNEDIAEALVDRLEDEVMSQLSGIGAGF